MMKKVSELKRIHWKDKQSIKYLEVKGLANSFSQGKIFVNPGSDIFSFAYRFLPALSWKAILQVTHTLHGSRQTLKLFFFLLKTFLNSCKCKQGFKVLCIRIQVL